jgi:hypothetical protein
MSDEDIESGGPWNDQIAAELEQADYGIICLTSTDLDRPWCYSKLVLSEAIDAARVVPLLIDLNPADVTMPLASFQGRPLTKEGMKRLVHDVSAARENPMPTEQVDVLFDGIWPRLEAVVAEAIRIALERREPKRTPEDMLAELIDTGRVWNAAWMHLFERHEFTPKNTGIRSGQRRCLECDRRHKRDHSARRRGARRTNDGG